MQLKFQNVELGWLRCANLIASDVNLRNNPIQCVQLSMHLNLHILFELFLLLIMTSNEQMLFVYSDFLQGQIFLLANSFLLGQDALA